MIPVHNSHQWCEYEYNFSSAYPPSVCDTVHDKYLRKSWSVIVLSVADHSVISLLLYIGRFSGLKNLQYVNWQGMRDNLLFWDHNFSWERIAKAQLYLCRCEGQVWSGLHLSKFLWAFVFWRQQNSFFWYIGLRWHIGNLFCDGIGFQRP